MYISNTYILHYYQEITRNYTEMKSIILEKKKNIKRILFFQCLPI